MMSKKVEKVLRLVVLTMVLVVLSVGDVIAKTKSSVVNNSKNKATQIYDRYAVNPILRKNGKVDWWEMNQTYSTRFRVEQLVVPVSLVGLGVLGIGENSPMRGINLAIRNGLNEASGGVKLRFDDYVQYVPVAFYLTLDFMGLKAKHSFGERVAVAAVTYIAVTALSQGLKYTVREPRPDTGTRNSFPSGHTMTAFAGAELVRSEYGWGVGMGAYALATTVGFMRMYNGRHWFNDVLAGAGLGILSARIGYWMLPLNRHIFRIPRKGQAMVASPVYYANTKAVGMSCAIQF
ncbi:MAG: phosphatase PAP2 family protein [Rikenellaceae bacterium]|nr:phosphatase PAP2 family protein [Rikenellaceae bacterium]